MTLHRIKGDDVVFECDECADTFESGTRDFYDACTALAAEGWKPRQHVNGLWMHICATCIARKKRQDRR